MWDHIGWGRYHMAATEKTQDDAQADSIKS
jgi:hypothetical protein